MAIQMENQLLAAEGMEKNQSFACENAMQYAYEKEFNDKI